MDKKDYLIINSAILPEIFSKVVEAKKLIATGQAANAAAAAKAAGISRSAFYKYKDNVFSYSDRANIRTIDMRAVLADRAGVFSALTAQLYKSGVNILTLNQDLPHDGTATVSLTLRTDELNTSVDGLIMAIKNIDGVISVTVV